ncbi:MAG: kanamycin nucleotidyltransferase C-terminal domain-containing protein [archaeon]
MKRRDRLVIADSVKKQIFNKYGKEVLAIAVYGSLAQELDERYSDVEMYTILKKDYKDKNNNFAIYKGIPVSYWLITDNEVLEKIKEIDGSWPEWPQNVVTYLDPLVLYDYGNIFEKYKKIVDKIPQKIFMSEAEKTMLLLYEQICKIKNANLKKDDFNLVYESRELAWFVFMFVAFVNRKYYTSTKTRLSESVKFGKLPKDYERLMQILLGMGRVDNKKLYESSLEMWKNIFVFGKRLGMGLKEIRSFRGFVR